MKERHEDPKVEVRQTGGSKETVETHPSYGLLSFSRVSGGHDNLFGSSIKHNNTIRLEIMRAEKHRNLHRDWFFGKEELIEVEMSPTQFSEAITSMNMGSGIPVTIKYVKRERMPDCPEVNQRQTFENEFKEDVHEVTNFMEELKKELDEIMAKKTILKGDREKIVGMVEKLIRETRSNIPFIQTQFNEAMDKTVTEAKGEVEASILHAVVAAGLDAIAKGDAKELIAKQFPQLTEGEDLEDEG